MARLHGSKGQVLMDADQGSPGGSPFSPVLIASLNEWTLDRARDRVDVTSFGDVNKQYVQGLPDIKGSLKGFLDTEDLGFLDAADEEDAVYLHLVPRSTASLKWKGSAFVDANIAVPANGAAAITGSFVAAGPWSRVN